MRSGSRNRKQVECANCGKAGLTSQTVFATSTVSVLHRADDVFAACASPRVQAVPYTGDWHVCSVSENFFMIRRIEVTPKARGQQTF